MGTLATNYWLANTLCITEGSVAKRGPSVLNKSLRMGAVAKCFLQIKVASHSGKFDSIGRPLQSLIVAANY